MRRTQKKRPPFLLPSPISEREYIVTNTYPDVGLYAFRSNAYTAMHANTPSAWLGAYRCRDDFAPRVHVNAVEARGVSAHPCRVGAVGVSLLRDGYRHRYIYSIISVLYPNCVNPHNSRFNQYGLCYAQRIMYDYGIYFGRWRIPFADMLV